VLRLLSQLNFSGGATVGKRRGLSGRALDFAGEAGTVPEAFAGGAGQFVDSIFQVLETLVRLNLAS
jgi:hypothetical protein